jgi:polyphosphate kinase 2 (PPK2 family)
MDLSEYRVTGDKGNPLKDRDPRDAAGLSKGRESDALLTENIARLARRQDILYAHNRYGVLVVLQAMDAAGKDGVIKHVMSGLNPQGVQVKSFKAPPRTRSTTTTSGVPRRICPPGATSRFFNRSYYEDVVVVRLHNLLAAQNMPDELSDGPVWEDRHRQIRDYERYLTENGIVVVKIFLHLSDGRAAPSGCSADR